MVAVLNEVQIFDQQIVPTGPVTEELSNLFDRLVVELAPFRESPRTLAGADMSCRAIWTAALRDTLLHHFPFAETPPGILLPKQAKRAPQGLLGLIPR